jgi:hypothetical protein
LYTGIGGGSLLLSRLQTTQSRLPMPCDQNFLRHFRHLRCFPSFMVGCTLSCVRPLDTAGNAFHRAFLEPHQGFFEFRQGDGVVSASELAGLKAAKSVNHDGDQVFVLHAIDAGFLDRTFLEVDRWPAARFPSKQLNAVLVARAAIAGLVERENLVNRGFAGNEIVCKLSHSFS